MGRGLLAVGIVVILVAAPLGFAAVLSEKPVFASKKNERNPAAARDTGGTDVWAFTRNRTGHPNRYDAYAKVGTTAAIKLNTSGQGWTGGIDYPTVVYQRINSGRSNLFLYDLSTGLRPPSPPGVNTSKWEWHPTISGDWLLFNRDNNATPTRRVVLHNRTTNEERLLSVVSNGSHYVRADQVNGDWATYTRCVPRCNVIRYQISSNTRTRLPKPATGPPRDQYAGSVTSTGAVYLLRSGLTCGSRVRIVRYDPNRGDPAAGTVVAALPAGRDVLFSHARENADGSVDVFYDRATCSTERWDIYKVTDPAPTP